VRNSSLLIVNPKKVNLLSYANNNSIFFQKSKFTFLIILINSVRVLPIGARRAPPDGYAAASPLGHPQGKKKTLGLCPKPRTRRVAGVAHPKDGRATLRVSVWAPAYVKGLSRHKNQSADWYLFHASLDIALRPFLLGQRKKAPFGSFHDIKISHKSTKYQSQID
jgi:hypothetical protein